MKRSHFVACIGMAALPVLTGALPSAQASVASHQGAVAAAQSSGPVQATDGTGRVIRLAHPATRITCVYGASCWGILAALGLRPTASTTATSDMEARAYFGAAATKIQLITWNSVESVASSSPQLIIARQGNEDLVQSEGVVAPVFMTANFNVAGIEHSTMAIGELTDRVAQARQAIQKFRATMATLAAEKPKNTPEKTVAIAEAYETGGYIIEAKNNPVCQALASYQLATCPFPALTGSTSGLAESEYSPEYVLKVDPDLFAFIGYPGAPSYTARTDPVWKRLKAERDGEVFQDNDSYSLFGQSLVGIEYASEEILHHLYPSAYRNPGPWMTWVPNQPS